MNELTKLNPVLASDLVAGGEIPVEWLWDTLIPRGALVMLSAYMKVGKSTLVYSLLSALAKGDEFCGHPTIKSKILLLAVEEHKREVVNRLIRFGVGKEGKIFVHVGPLHPTLINYTDIINLIKEQEIDLVVIDTLARYWTVTDENDNSEVGNALSPLLDIAHMTNATVLLIHHNSKVGGEHGKEVRGASSSFATVDQLISVSRYGDYASGQRILQVTGRYDQSPETLIVKLDDEGTGFVLVGTDAQAKQQAILDSIKEYLEANPGDHSISKLVAELKTKRQLMTRVMATPQPWFTREGAGKKGDPYIYRATKPREQAG